MKKYVFGLLILSCLETLAQEALEKEINSSIEKVIVYTQGAQIEREASFTLQQGRMILKLTGLSPYIKEESLRVSGDGSYTLLNVQHQDDFLNQLDKNRETESMQDRIEELQYKVEEEETWIKIVEEKLDFLNANKDMTGKDQVLNPETFASLNAIYGDNVASLLLESLKRRRLLSEYQKEIDNLNNQLNSLNAKADLPSGTIIVTIESKQTKTATLNVSYLVDNASWFPSYDIRFLGINRPLSLTYKANIRQNTGIDWKNVDLVLSTARTDLSAQIPEFTAYLLQYYYPEITRALQGRVAGIQVVDNSDLMELESTVRVRGAGPFGNTEPLYVVDGMPVENISYLSPDEIESVQVLKDASSAAVYGERAANGVVVITTRTGHEESLAPLVITSKRETMDEYMIDLPQTILSNDKEMNVTYKEADLNADFEYQTIPVLARNVFLIGKVNDWYKAELMDGEANIYFENSFVGKTFINTQQFSDTLEISFGIDNNIDIKREKITEYSGDQTIGFNRKEIAGYKTTIRNNKPYPVTVRLTDQVPVSTLKDIQVEPLDLSGGTYNDENGKVTWDVNLNSNESKEFILSFSVKYPRDKRIVLGQ